MKISSLTAIAVVFSCMMTPVRAADDLVLQRLALCQDSWIDWQKTNPAQMQKFATYFRGNFTPHGNDPYWLPKSDISILGLPVLQVFPESVGMGVGFSVNVAAPFGKARATMEKAVGKRFVHCESGEGMKSCELPIAEKRTAMIMASDPPDKNGTLVGCYYFYEK